MDTVVQIDSKTKLENFGASMALTYDNGIVRAEPVFQSLL